MSDGFPTIGTCSTITALSCGVTGGLDPCYPRLRRQGFATRRVESPIGALWDSNSQPRREYGQMFNRPSRLERKIFASRRTWCEKSRSFRRLFRWDLFLSYIFLNSFPSPYFPLVTSSPPKPYTHIHADRHSYGYMKNAENTTPTRRYPLHFFLSCEHGSLLCLVLFGI